MFRATPVCVCVCVCLWGFCNVWVFLVICILYFEVFLNLTEVLLTLTEVFPCLFLSCKANAKVKLAKTGHGLHSSTSVVICVVRWLFVLFYVLFVCKCVLPPGDNPIAVNKYITYQTPHPSPLYGLPPLQLPDPHVIIRLLFDFPTVSCQYWYIRR